MRSLQNHYKFTLSGPPEIWRVYFIFCSRETNAFAYFVQLTDKQKLLKYELYYVYYFQQIDIAYLSNYTK